ncbi:MAG: deoxyguanosinetriphosphate triphosphohydrolase [Gammaproteobacteria bacterium]
MASNQAARLATFAAREECSKGRRLAEPPPAYRSEFQRDRDRVIHSSAVRRLVYKTKVLVNHEGDLYRTRLTHSLEVAQIARTIAGALGLNEYLVEAICLAHDLGHTPFGHAGQDALNECMKAYGGFEHNFQSLRVVDELEEKYATFSGLNLMYESREGILKHCSKSRARKLGDLGERFLTGGQPSLEAQLADLADGIAYSCHDVDDGLRAGLLSIDNLREADIFDRQYRDVVSTYPDLDGRKQIYEIVRRMIGVMVGDVIVESRNRLTADDPPDIDAVRASTRRLIGFGSDFERGHRLLKRVLMKRLYKHDRVLSMTKRAENTLADLFEALFEDSELMPPEFRDAANQAQAAQGDTGRARVVSDYIAGMTDRYAIGMHDRLFSTSGERS